MTTVLKTKYFKRVLIFASLAFYAFGISGCGSKDPGGNNATTGTSGGADDPGIPAAPTYYQDVAPILGKRCVGCHQNGGAGSFTLDNYETTKQMASVIKHAVQSKTMPPWLVRDDGQCGEYKDSQALSDVEIQTIARWVDSGAAEGTPANISYPPIKSLTDYKEVITPKYVPEAKGGALAATDEYRCFLLENPSPDRRRFLNGYEVLPGNAAMVHHAVMFVVPGQKESDNGQTNKERLKSLDAESPNKPGWPCYSMVGEGVSVADLPIVWAPGQGAVEFAPETGSIIDPEDMVVLQVHYNLADPTVVGQSDQTKVRIRLTDSVKRQSLGLLWDDLLDTLSHPVPVAIPPGVTDFVYSSDIDLAGFGFDGLPFLDIQGFMPHMHEAGKSQRIEMLESETPRCVTDVPRWDFDWQLAYFYKEPIRWTPNQKLRNTCIFDTTNRTEPTLPGWGTRNEMCLATMFVLLPEGFMTR